MSVFRALVQTVVVLSLACAGSAHAALVAHYQLDGNGNDSSGLGHNGTVSGSPVTTTDRFGNANGALLFDGTDDIIRINDFAAMQPSSALTISAWVHRDSLATGGPNRRIVTKGDGSSSGIDDGFIFFAFNGSALNFGIADSNDTFRTVFSSTGVLTANTWHHVAAVFDNGAMRIYADGSEVGSGTFGGQTVIPDSAFRWGIGDEADQPGLNEVWDGGMDDVRIFNSALSASELMDIANDVGVPAPGAAALLLALGALPLLRRRRSA